MSRWISIGLLFLLVLASAWARAAPEADLWSDPADPGWGLSLHRQDGVMFAVLFLPGEDGRAPWYVASDIRDSGTHLDPIGTPIFEGRLYSTRGAPFAASDVGRLSVALMFPDRLGVAYSIEGRTVSKVLQRLTFRSDKARWNGDFIGTFRNRFPAYLQCDFFLPEALAFSAVPGEGNRVFLTIAGPAAAPRCQAELEYAQRGSLGEMTGRYSCLDPSTGRGDSGNIGFYDLVRNRHGVTGYMHADGAVCFGHGGPIAITKVATDRPAAYWPESDLWWDPGDPGWGLALHRQEGVTFAALFTYDAAGSPQWHVASDVREQGTLLDANRTQELSGALYSVSGSGATYRATEVGSLALHHFDVDRLQLSYRIGSRAAVVKSLRRQTWRDGLASATGEFRGAFSAETGGFDGQPAPRQAVSIRASGTDIMVTFSGMGGECTATGRWIAAGSLGRIDGTYLCPSRRVGDFRLTQAVSTPTGLSARLELEWGDRSVSGMLVLARP